MKKIIYNVTSNVEDDIREEWLNWMKKQHIPDLMRTGLFTDYKLLKLIAEEESGTTYAVQYFLNDIQDFLNYTQNFAPQLQKEVKEKYGEKVLSFRTLLEVIE